MRHRFAFRLSQGGYVLLGSTALPFGRVLVPCRLPTLRLRTSRPIADAKVPSDWCSAQTWVGLWGANAFERRRNEHSSCRLKFLATRSLQVSGTTYRFWITNGESELSSPISHESSFWEINGSSIEAAFPSIGGNCELVEDTPPESGIQKSPFCIKASLSDSPSAPRLLEELVRKRLSLSAADPKSVLLLWSSREMITMTLIRRTPKIPYPCQRMRKPLEIGLSFLCESSIESDYLALFELVPSNSLQSALGECE